MAVLTVSDACSRGERTDTSGGAIAVWAETRGDHVVEHAVVADDTVEIVRRLLAWCDGAGVDLVMTTGGTGLAPRDVTVEATRAVIEREAPGLVEHIRARGMERSPRAALSRAMAGSRHHTLIVNLPGSLAGVRDALASLDALIDHAVAILRDRPTDHSPGTVA